MDNTILHQDIRLVDLGAVDEYGPVIIAPDRNVPAIQSLHGRIGQVTTVQDLARDDVVGEDVSQLLIRHVLGDGRDGRKGLVIGREDGNVAHPVDLVGQTGTLDSAGGSGQVAGNESIGDIARDGEDAVDDVHGAAGIVERMAVGEAGGLLEARDEGHVAVPVRGAGSAFDALPARDVAILFVV